MSTVRFSTFRGLDSDSGPLVADPYSKELRFRVLLFYPYKSRGIHIPNRVTGFGRKRLRLTGKSLNDRFLGFVFFVDPVLFAVLSIRTIFFYRTWSYDINFDQSP